MNILEFHNRFRDEQDCRDYLRKKREESGIICKKCGYDGHYFLENQLSWRCKQCESSTNLRAGTIMEKSHLPIMYWFMTIHLMTSTKKAFSALELQRQLGHKRYEPIWLMMQKVRISMGKRDAIYELTGEVEIDDAFFETVNLEDRKKDKDDFDTDDRRNNNEDKPLMKRGRGSQKQLKVLVMVESKSIPESEKQKKYKHKPNRSMGYVKMVVIDELTNNGINYEIKNAVNKNSTALTDGFRGYSRVKDVLEEHNQMVVPSKEAHKKLPWVHTTISNAKKLLLGVHHSVGKEYLQNYLNEFCYKLNRRYVADTLFDRMLTVGADNTWY